MNDATTPQRLIPIVASGVWGVLAIPGLLGVALAPMMFDAPGSMNNPVAWINVAIIVSFPCLCLISICASWIAWWRLRTHPTRRSAWVQIAFASLPMLPILYVCGALIVGFIGVIVSGQPLGLTETTIAH